MRNKKRKTVKGTLVEDITGFISGNLKVKSFYEIKNGKTFWLCVCKCGNEHIVSAGHLKDKNIKSCGHCGENKLYGRIIDLRGKKFCKLEIIKFDKVENGRTFWIAKCECGREKPVDGGDFQRGRVKSCGLCNNYVEGTLAVDISGNRYGNLKVISFNKIEKEHTYFNCICDCGNECVAEVSQLNKNRKKNCGHCYRKRIEGTLIQDLTGETHGFLKVTGFDRRENGLSYFFCTCVCGNKISVPATLLKINHTVSCGCSKESYLASKLKDYYVEKYNAKKEHKVIINKETGKWLKCDIYIPSENIFIEINGGQHYKFVPFFHRTYEQYLYQKKLYKIKKKEMIRNGILIEIDMRKINNFEDSISYISSFIT